jgi:competence protein ComEC
VRVRHPASLPAIALASGIAAGVFLDSPLLSPSLFILVIAAAWLVAAAAYYVHHHRAFFGAVWFGFAASGLALGATANDTALRTPLGALFDHRIPPHEYQLFGKLEGTLRADALRGPNGASLSVAVDRIELEGAGFTTSGGAIISVGGDLASGRIAEWRAGRHIRAPVTLRRPATYLDPGVADAKRDFGWKGTSLVGSVKSDGLVEVTACGTSLSEAIAAARAGIRAGVAATVAPWSDRSAAVVTAILIGDRAGLDDEMQRRLQEAGTYHVIAISGGNIAILAGLCVLLLKLLRFGPRMSAAVIIVILIAYAPVAGGGASVGRATLMAVCYFAAQLGDLRSTPANVAAASAAALFCINPLEVVDASFALTFGATLGLLVGMPRLKRPPAMSGWVFAGVALLTASICAEVALLPVGALVFSRVTAAGLLLNFAAIPLMTVVQVSGMAAVALLHVSSRAALCAGYVSHLGVRGILASASLVDVWPWMATRVPPPSLWLVATYYGALVAALMARTRYPRGISRAAVAACALWIVVAPAPRPSRSLHVTFLDVGQGDAALVQFPDGRTLSVDAGGLAGAAFDIGARVVSPTFWALGVRRLDYLSFSHGDPDHIGGAASVFADFGPKEVWAGVPVPPHEPTQKLRALADRAAVPWRTLLAGDRLDFGDVQLSVHHPPLPDWERQRVRNDDSEVMEIRYGSVSFVFTGDIGREVEETIASSFPRAPIRILKVPHHGSATSSSMEFLRALRPNIAVISDGRGNPYGHPVPAVVDRYRAVGAAIYRTDLDGAVTVDTDGQTVRVRTFTNRRLTLRARD